MFLFTTWSRGNPDDTRFLNNIFYVDGKVRYMWGDRAPTTFLRATSSSGGTIRRRRGRATATQNRCSVTSDTRRTGNRFA